MNIVIFSYLSKLRACTVLMMVIIALSISCGKAGNNDDDIADETVVNMTAEVYVASGKVTVDRDIYIRELIDSEIKCKVEVISHRLILLGKYNVDKSSLVAIPVSKQSECNIDAEFVGLPSTVAIINGDPINVTGISRKGIEYKVRAKRPGIYLFMAKWKYSTGNKSEWVSSMPTVISVDVAENRDGKKEYKKEWDR